MSGYQQTELRASTQQAFNETHFAVSYWARLWGFSPRRSTNGSAMNTDPGFCASRIAGGDRNAITPPSWFRRVPQSEFMPSAPRRS